MIRRLFTPLMALLLCVLAVADGSPAADKTPADSDGHAWFSYRDTYQAMIRFEKYADPKYLVQIHLQVVVAGGGAMPADTRLTLEGKTIHLALPLDEVGRAVYPLMKAAYDENAELRLNLPQGQAKLRPRVSIIPRPDGVYQAADLRSACDQTLQFLRYVERGNFGSKRCLGVLFAFPRNAEAVAVRFKDADRGAHLLPVSEGGAFWGDAAAGYQTVAYRFAEWPPSGQITTVSAPLAISAILQ